jgi:hypothetical protein
MAEAANLTQKAADLLGIGRVAEAEEAERQAQRLRVRAFRLARNAEMNTPAEPFVSAQTERETIVQGLIELDAIASPRLVADYLAARFARFVSPRQFSSLRRDERRRSFGRSALIVPALEGSYFEPARGVLAVSSWPTWRRLIGPRTGRVELLRVGRNVLQQLDWLAETDQSTSDRMERLVLSLVRTVPGALDGWKLRDRSRTRKAVERELSVLEGPDTEWRMSAAERAEAQLDEEQLVWGAAPPHIVKAGDRRA